nr:immunoglobulin light chain junction region [Macaca mulatta]MOW74265.1 immunoglobulin light chain junction region [Macaca mulatta]
CLQRSGWPHSF